MFICNQELGDQLNKLTAEKEKALKSLKTLKVSHDVSTCILCGCQNN